MSERNPTSARKGAKTRGSASITATTEAWTRSSTIITRLSVPMRSTAAMPTVTWNSASRRRRPSGSSGVAASAKGRIAGVRRIRARVRVWVGAVIALPLP